MSTYNNQAMFFFQKPENYYRQDFVRILRREKDGFEILVLYEELLIETLNKDGILAKVFGEELVSYSTDELAFNFLHKKRIVENGIKRLKELKVIEEKDNGILFFPHALLFTKRTTIGAEKKKKQRSKKIEKLDNCPTYIELEEEIEQKENKIIIDEEENIIEESSENEEEKNRRFEELLDELSMR